MVDLLSLIDLLKEKKVVQYPVICFAGETYQLIFFSLFIKKVATFLGKQLNKIQFESYEPTSISQLIEISFLGNSLLYWFGDIESYFAAKTKSFFSHLINYQGPHNVWLFVKKDILPLEFANQKNVLVVSLDLDRRKIIKVIEFLFEDISQKYERMESLFSKSSLPERSLDQVCLLAYYCNVLNPKQLMQLGNEWKEILVAEEHSLFTLSGLFFSKKKKLFFQMWYTIAQKYALPFWTSYWSDQLFRAACFIISNKGNTSSESKKIAYKLPFSFINYDWKKISLIELEKAHNFLYCLDYHFKQGGSDKSIDLLFMEFFSN